MLWRSASGVDMSESAQAMDAIREVGPGGHYLGCAHTQANFKDAFWRTGVLLSAKGDCLVATHWDRNVIPAQRTVRLSTVASVSISERRSPAGALVTVIDVHLTSGEVIRCGRPRRAFRPQPPLQTLNEAVAAANAKATATN